jgi:hypothetical protein
MGLRLKLVQDGHSAVLDRDGSDSRSRSRISEERSRFPVEDKDAIAISTLPALGAGFRQERLIGVGGLPKFE